MTSDWCWRPSLFSPLGKNDGSVGGHRYFHCKPGYGVLVRPDRLSYRDRTSRRTGEFSAPAHVPVLRGEAIVARRGENRKSWSSWDRETRSWMGEMNSPQNNTSSSSSSSSYATGSHIRTDILPTIVWKHSHHIHSQGMGKNRIKTLKRRELVERLCREYRSPWKDYLSCGKMMLNEWRSVGRLLRRNRSQCRLCHVWSVGALQGSGLEVADWMIFLGCFLNWYTGMQTSHYICRSHFYIECRKKRMRKIKCFILSSLIYLPPFLFFTIISYT